MKMSEIRLVSNGDWKFQWHDDFIWTDDNTAAMVGLHVGLGKAGRNKAKSQTI